MVDLVITPSDVVPTGSSVIKHGYAGATIVAGQTVYLDASDNRYKLADTDDTDADVPAGIALNGASAGQPVAVCGGGDLTLGTVLTAGTAYYLSETPGGIQPAADLGSGEAVAQLGIAKSTSVLAMRIITPGVTLP